MLFTQRYGKILKIKKGVGGIGNRKEKFLEIN